MQGVLVDCFGACLADAQSRQPPVELEGHRGIMLGVLLARLGARWGQDSLVVCGSPKHRFPVGARVRRLWETCQHEVLAESLGGTVVLDALRKAHGQIDVWKVS